MPRYVLPPLVGILPKTAYETIDNLVDFYTIKIDESKCIHRSVYEHLLHYESFIVLEVLQSKTNKPSVHDLYLIKYISVLRFIDSFRVDNCINMLIEYKKRKDL